MDIILWGLIGGALGWLSFLYLRFNEARGRNASIALGAAGGLIGGEAIAPMFTAAAAAPDGFNMPGLFFAAVAAVGLLAIGNMVYVRWGV